MTDTGAPIAPESDDLADEFAASVQQFLAALRAIAAAGDAGGAIPLLLLEISQVSLCGARLGIQNDFTPSAEYQPDVGPEADLEDLRVHLAQMFDTVDTYGYVFDPYVPEVVESQLSDDLTSIASDLENGLRHYRAGDLDEALWWWQFSYVANWGNLAGAALNALLSVVSHNRLDAEFTGEADVVAAADEMLEEGEPLAT
ncbi:DUF5063 domain-containing protein [Nocardioides sp.]|uniref:DUF5063 domain-containing protein n=1 Tax=Nocardioides sp. TaxID=35761 RepID=UPI0035662AE0